MDLNLNSNKSESEHLLKHSKDEETFMNNKISKLLLGILIVSLTLNVVFFCTFIWFITQQTDNWDKWQNQLNELANKQSSTYSTYNFQGSKTLESSSDGFPCPASSIPPAVPLSNPLQYYGIRQAISQMDQQIQQLKDKLNISSISVGLVYDQDLIWTQSYGYANPWKKLKSDANTIYRIGSVTKVFTNLMMMQLRDNGKLQLDDPVEKYEPRFSRIQNLYQFPTKRKITLRQLASHTSGLPPEVSCFPPESSCTADEAYEYISNLTLILPQYTHPSYSNFGFSVLGQVLGIVANQTSPSGNVTYESYMNDNIIKPLGMNGTGFVFTQDVIDRIAIGFYQNGQQAPLYDSGFDNPNGQMYASTNDVAKLLSLMFYNGPFVPDSNRILDGVTITEMQLPIFVNDDGNSAWGLPWEMVRINGHWVRTKGGAVDGYSVHIAFIPKLRLGLSVFTSLDGIDPSTVTIPNLYNLAQSFTCALSENQANPPSPPNPQGFVGVFQNSGSQFQVEYDPNQAVLIGTFDGTQKVLLEWIDTLRFRLHSLNLLQSCMSVGFSVIEGELAVFEFAKDGKTISSLSFPGYQFLNTTWTKIF